MFKMGDILRKVQEFQEQVNKMKEDLGKKTVEGQSGAGMVRATANGNAYLQDLQIDKELINPEDPEMLRDLIIAAVNDSLRKAKELQESEMSAIAGDSGLGNLMGNFKIPGLF